MALHEEKKEQNQQTWRSKIAQGREDISASVEEALADTSLEDEWDGDEDGAYALQTSNKTALIPPKLSLQSKMLPTVRQGGFVQAATGMHPAASVSSLLPIPPSVPDEEKKPTTNTSMLKRLAQRLTSSLSVFGSSMQPDIPPVVTSSVAPVAERSEVQTRLHDSLPQAREDVHISSRRTGPLPATIVDAVPSARPVDAPLQASQSKQRLAGHTTKVRLQTTELPALRASVSSVESRMSNESEEQSQSTGSNKSGFEVHEPLDIIVRAYPREEKQPPSLSSFPLPVSLSVASVASATSGSTDAFPVLGHTKSDADLALRKECFGTDTFGSGQGDVMVRNTHVTASSVVIITLTSNPGPVAVHYVTLQPEVGFTVHLTAPTTAKTPFNYVVLGE